MIGSTTPNMIGVFLLAAALAACSGGSETARSGPAAANTSSASSNSDPASTAQPASSSTNVVPPNSVNAAENPLLAAKREKIDAMRRAGSNPAAAKADTETLLRQSTRPAPENSEFAIALTDVVVERRTFLQHPVLARVEKITDGKTSRIKLLTKDGRTVHLPGTAIEQLSVASSASILKAAGIEAPAHRPSDRKPGAANAN